MICEQCKKNVATVVFTAIINGEKRERRLCPNCVSGAGQQFIAALSLSDLLGGLFEQNNPPVEGPRCPRCGMSHAQFRAGGKLGCQQCYETFHAQLEPLLRRVHGKSLHAGKIPSHCSEHVKNARELQSLKEALSKAVEVEDFESAAQLRDRMKELKGESQHG